MEQVRDLLQQWETELLSPFQLENRQARLQYALEDLRDNYETQIQQNREEVATLYKIRIQNLERVALERNTNNEKLLQARTKLDGLNSKLTELELANNHLKVICSFGVNGSYILTFVFTRPA